MDIESIEDDEVRAEIHRALQHVKAGDAFLKSKLQESDCERILLDEDILARFLTYVSRSMTETWRKKAEKQVSLLMQSKRDIWVQEIRNFNRDSSHNNAKNEAEESIEPHDMEESSVAPKHSNKRNADDKSSQEKPKAKKPKRDSSAKKKSPKTRVAASPEELEKARVVAKRDFETEKARILGEVPEEHKAKWGQIGFSKWGQNWVPCLILGPYDVSPLSAMRRVWLKMFENVSCSIPYLVSILCAHFTLRAESLTVPVLILV
jgi:hypothetical protein